MSAPVLPYLSEVKSLYEALIEMEADLLGLSIETFKRCLERKLVEV